MLEVEEGDRVEWVCMANGWTVAILGWLIWALIAGLNVYLIVMLCLGNG
jgi:Mn2+/Fe2+ NRAMP family transporter